MTDYLHDYLYALDRMIFMASIAKAAGKRQPYANFSDDYKRISATYASYPVPLPYKYRSGTEIYPIYTTEGRSWYEKFFHGIENMPSYISLSKWPDNYATIREGHTAVTQLVVGDLGLHWGEFRYTQKGRPWDQVNAFQYAKSSRFPSLIELNNSLLSMSLGSFHQTNAPAIYADKVLATWHPDVQRPGNVQAVSFGFSAYVERGHVNSISLGRDFQGKVYIRGKDYVPTEISTADFSLDRLDIFPTPQDEMIFMQDLATYIEGQKPGST